LGEAYNGLRDPQQAHANFMEQLQLCQRANYKWGICAALNDVGMTALALGDHEAAQAHFAEALGQAINIRAQALAIAAIQGFAALHFAANSTAKALELITFVLAHPAIDARTREHADSLLETMSATLFPHQIEAAQQAAAEKKLSEVAAALLAG
jgi:hypothetical protein